MLSFSPPRSRWKQTFLEALNKEDEAGLGLLLSGDPAAPPLEQRDYLLVWALEQTQTWGVRWLLEKGVVVTPAVIRGFFKQMGGCWDLPGRTRDTVGYLWPLLLPGVLASQTCRAEALVGYLTMGVSQRMEPYVKWQDFGLDDVARGLEKTPLKARGKVGLMTPLQWAWVFNKPQAARHLLELDGSCQGVVPKTSLGQWTLRSALELAEQCQQRAEKAPQFIERMVPLWGLKTAEVLEEHGLTDWACPGYPSHQEETWEKWAPVMAWLKADRLEETLKGASGGGQKMRL